MSRPLRNNRASDMTEVPDEEAPELPTVDDAAAAVEDRASTVEDVASVMFTCANWGLQVYVAVMLNEDLVLGVGKYAWVSAFVAVPLAANICAIVCWLLYSPAKGFLRRFEREPDAQVLVLLLGTISTDALALLSEHDQDRAIVRTLGLISNFLADIPFFAIELQLILSGNASRVLIASCVLNLLSIAFKLTRNWIILILSYNRWWRYRRVRVSTLRIAQNLRVEDALTLPLSLAFWLLCVFFTAAISTRPLPSAQLAPALGELHTDWERELVRCYIAAVCAFFVNAAANGLLWTGYLRNPRFGHEWMLRRPLLCALVGVTGLVDSGALNALTQNAMWHERVLANGLLARLLAFDFPLLLISWRVFALLTSAQCLAERECAHFAGASASAWLTAMPTCAMAAVWWKVYRLLVSHVTQGALADVSLSWTDSELRPLSAEAAFALCRPEQGADDDLDLQALAAEAAMLEEASALLAPQASAPAKQPSGGADAAGAGGGGGGGGGAPSTAAGRALAAAHWPHTRARMSLLAGGTARGGLSWAAPLSQLSSSLLLGAAETPDRLLLLLPDGQQQQQPQQPTGSGGALDGWPPGKAGAPAAPLGRRFSSLPLLGRFLPRRPAEGEAEEKGAAQDGGHSNGCSAPLPSGTPQHQGRADEAEGAASKRSAATTTASSLTSASRRGSTPTAASSSRRGSAASSVGDLAAGGKGRGRKGRGRARARKPAGGVVSAREAAIMEAEEEEVLRKRQRKLQRGRSAARRPRRHREADFADGGPTLCLQLWAGYQRLAGGSRWLGQLPMLALCVANLVQRLLLVAAAWRLPDPARPGSGLVGQLCLGLLALTTLSSVLAAAAALRRGAAPQLKSAMRASPLRSALALSVLTFDPGMAGALLEGFDAFAVSLWSVLVQDAPWLALQALFAQRHGWAGPLRLALGLHLGLLLWKLLRVLLLGLARSSPPELPRSLFRFSRWGDLLPLLLSYSQLALLLALTLRAWWLLERGAPAFDALQLEVGPAFTAETDALLRSLVTAVLCIFGAGVLARVCVLAFFLHHPAFAHRGIYRHSMASSALAVVSLGEGSAFTPLAKSAVSHKVYQLATSACSLALYDVPIAVLLGAYYFKLLDFNRLGVRVAGRSLEDLLRAAAIVSIVVVLFRVFNLVLLKATLFDSAANGNPFADSTLFGCLSRTLGACCRCVPSLPSLPKVSMPRLPASTRRRAGKADAEHGDARANGEHDDDDDDDPARNAV